MFSTYAEGWKMPKKLLLAAILLFSGILFSACNQSVKPTTEDTVTVVDDYQRKVSIPAHPQRIVSASPAITEILFALGSGNLVVGRTEYCTYPEEALEVENIGGISNLNVEKIASLKPDLVLSGSMVPEQAVSQLQALGIPVACVIEKNTFNELYSNISKVSRMIGKPEKGDSLNRVLKEKMNSLQKLPSGSPTVYYVVGFGKNGNYTAGGSTFINDIISLAGGRNIASDVTGWEYSLEALMNQNPDVIVIRSEDSASFCTTKPYSTLKAVKEGKVVAIESGMIDLQVPRNVDCVKLLNERFAAF